MAIGIVSGDELRSELESLQKNEDENGRAAEIREQNIGRGKDNREVPESLRKVIVDTAVEEGHKEGVALAKEFGISESSVSAYQRGSTSTASYHDPNPDLLDHVNKKKKKITGKARKKLLSALKHITSDKLEEADPRDLSGIAKDMSAIIRNMEPPSEKDRGSGVQFVFFTPPMRGEEQFEVIDVKE